MQAFTVWLQGILIAFLHQARRQLIAGVAASYGRAIACTSTAMVVCRYGETVK